MQLSRSLKEKAGESLTAAHACEDGDVVSETKLHCILEEYWFIHQQYTKAWDYLCWISDQAGQLELSMMTFLMKRFKKPIYYWE